MRRQWLSGKNAQILEPLRSTKMDQGVAQQYRGALSERDDIKGNKDNTRTLEVTYRIAVFQEEICPIPHCTIVLSLKPHYLFNTELNLAITHLSYGQICPMTVVQ